MPGAPCSAKPIFRNNSSFLMAATSSLAMPEAAVIAILLICGDLKYGSMNEACDRTGDLSNLATSFCPWWTQINHRHTPRAQKHVESAR